STSQYLTLSLLSRTGNSGNHRKRLLQHLLDAFSPEAKNLASPNTDPHRLEEAVSVMLGELFLSQLPAQSLFLYRDRGSAIASETRGGAEGRLRKEIESLIVIPATEVGPVLSHHASVVFT